MDFKSLLIGALGATLVFISLGAKSSSNAALQDTSDSLVWDFFLNESSEHYAAEAFAINKQTGEVRKYVTGVRLEGGYWDEYSEAKPK